MIVEETNQLLETLNGVTEVHAHFYELSSSYNKVCETPYSIGTFIAAYSSSACAICHERDNSSPCSLRCVTP